MSEKNLKNDRIQEAFEKLAVKDMSGMDELYAAVGLDVYALALSRMDSEAAAKALVQETFVLAYRYAKRYRDENNGRDFVLNIVNNLANMKNKEDKSLFSSKLGMKKNVKVAKSLLEADASGIKSICEDASSSDFTYDYVPAKTPEQKRNQWIVVGVIALIIFVIGCLFGGRNKLNSKIIASVYVDAEERIELSVNKKLQVYEAKGLDDDSEEYVVNLGLEGQPLDIALKNLTGYMYMNNELDAKALSDDEDAKEIAAAILLSVSAEDEAFDEVLPLIQTAFENAEDDAYSVILQRIDAEMVSDQADEAEVTVGKYCLVKSIIASTEDYSSDDFDQLKLATIRELAVIYNGLDSVEAADEDNDEVSEEEKDSKDDASDDSSKKEEGTASAGDDSDDNSSSNIIVLVKDKTDEIVSDTKDKISDAASDAVDNVVEGAKDKAEEAIEGAVDNAIDGAKEQIPDNVDTDSLKKTIMDFIKGLFK